MVEKQTEGNTFTEEGRLAQAEFAIKSVNDAGTVIGMVCTNGVVLIGVNTVKSVNIEKIYEVNSKTFVAVAGLFSDALRLLKFARLRSANIKEEIGKDPRISTLCELMSQEKQLYTQMAGARPFGVTFLYGGYENDEYVLFSTDPSGTVNRWKAYSFGMDSEAVNTHLRNEILEAECNTSEGVEKLLRIYLKAKEWSSDLVERLEILSFKGHSGRFMNKDEIENLVARIQSEKA